MPNKRQAGSDNLQYGSDNYSDEKKGAFTAPFFAKNFIFFKFSFFSFPGVFQYKLSIRSVSARQRQTASDSVR